jgi:hypothetical protein
MQGKLKRLIHQMMNDADTLVWGSLYQTTKPIPRDGEWFALGAADNVGSKLLRYGVEVGQLERRDVNCAIMRDFYRVAREEDFGDLWVV